MDTSTHGKGLGRGQDPGETSPVGDQATRTLVLWPTPPSNRVPLPRQNRYPVISNPVPSGRVSPGANGGIPETLELTDGRPSRFGEGCETEGSKESNLH